MLVNSGKKIDKKTTFSCQMSNNAHAIQSLRIIIFFKTYCKLYKSMV